MKRLLCSVLVVLLALGAYPAMAEAVSISCKVVRVNEYGHAKLDITEADFTGAGFALGDVVTVTGGSYTGDMPVFNGYYTDRGGFLVRIDPNDGDIGLCINYGNFSEASGLVAGDEVTITLKERGGALETQELNELVYSDERADFASDVVFANFRPVVEGKLYRSASPINNKANRAHYADSLIRQAGVQAVMNMADTPEDIAAYIAAEDFASPYYRDLVEAGKVCALKMPTDFAAGSFAPGIVAGFSFLAEQEPPYLVHCLEGKDRTGFAIMMLEALMGWSQAQIVDDYMKTYDNYYGILPGTTKYDLVVEKNIREMLDYVAGPAETDLKAAAQAYLVDNGMSGEALKQLEAKLE